MLLIPLIALTMRVASVPTANLSYLLIGVYALKGRAQAIQAFTLTWLFLMLNPAIAPSASAASIGRYGVLFAAVVSILIHRPATSSFRSGKSLVRATLLLGAFFIIHSVIISPIIDVSVLKSISWTLVMTTLIAGWSGLSDKQRELLSHQLFICLTGVMVLSLPFLALPAGYTVNGTGFQGIFGHPQGFGLTMAILGAWTAAQILALQRPPWRLIIMASVCAVLVYLSEARTGALAMILGVAIAVITSSVLSGRSAQDLMPGLRSSRVRIVFGLMLLAMILAWPMLVERTEDFMTKRGGSSNVLEAYDMSRGDLIDAMRRNIDENPWQGIGFSMASIPSLTIVTRDPVFGLPTSALIEKGVMPIAVLEEVGVLGFLFVAAWLWVMLRHTARAGAEPLAVFLVILLINMGEATLFSPGGAGLLALILIGWGATSERIESRRQ